MICEYCNKEFIQTRPDKKYCNSKCKDKSSRKKNGWRVSKRRSWKKQNISSSFKLNDYFLLVEKQENRCAICNRHRSELTYDLCVDHDHITGKIRGLLCHKCNCGLGIFKDNVEILQKSINYLQS